MSTFGPDLTAAGSEAGEVVPCRSDADLVVVRQLVRRRAAELGFSLVNQTKLVTAASELARNAVQYGGGGAMRLDVVADGVRRGLRLIFEDRGPGIADLALALTDGYTTGQGLGLGLSGSKRLVSEFDVKTAPGEGTRVTVVLWK
ncbi:anti-sigma regulatory factor [Gemmatimonadetes bacterium T265]|nr:anti-sigma regulatory factor [Gemmatimonadetes bacterium T265]